MSGDADLVFYCSNVPVPADPLEAKKENENEKEGDEEGEEGGRERVSEKNCGGMGSSVSDVNVIAASKGSPSKDGRAACRMSSLPPHMIPSGGTTGMGVVQGRSDSINSRTGLVMSGDRESDGDRDSDGSPFDSDE